MDVATPQSDLYNKLLQIGWTLKKIDFKQGVYTAKAENQTTGQEIERAAKSPEMALAAVLRYAVAANEVRRFATKKFASWDSDWSGNSSDIAQAYAQMPAFEQKAVPAWKALAAEANVQATAIKKQITVEVVDDPDPYMDVKQLIEDVHQNRHVSVSRANSDHPVWTVEDVVNFRTVLDVIGHAQRGADFSYSGEVKAAETWMPLLSPLAREALFTEVIGRGAYDKAFRGNAPHKIGLLSQFLHPVQEKQGEHVWIPHGGLPELAPQEEQPMTPFGPAVPEGYASPAFERDPAVMEGYKPQKITRSEVLAALEWGEQGDQQQQPQWVTSIPCPQNIPIKPEREVEYPDWVPEEDDPLTVPEEWPEEAPEPAPEREKEPAVSKVRVSNEDLPLHYSNEPGYGWKILLTDENGNLMSPSQGTIWPVGQPLVAEGFNLDEFKRNEGGIHLVPEGDWSELYTYSKYENSVLVKCKLFGRTLEGTTAHGRGMLASKAMPVLAVSPHQDLLLKIANKYGIDTEVVGDQPEVDQQEAGPYGETIYQKDGWRLIDPEGTPGQNPPVFPENASYKNFTFDPPQERRHRTYRGQHVYDVLDPDGNPAGEIEMRLEDDYHGKIDFCEVYEIRCDEDAQPFVKSFFESLVYANPEYPKSEAWENGDWDYDFWPDDRRDKESITDANELVSLINGGQTRYGYNLDNFSYDGWEYEWDDGDVEYELLDPDEWGVRPYGITIKELPPPILDFEPDSWTQIFHEEVESLKSGWGEPNSNDLARALVEVPEFILSENAQDGTDARKAWEQVGGLNFIKGEIDDVRWRMSADGEQPSLELTDWLYQLESVMAGAGGRGGWSMNPGQPPLFTKPTDEFPGGKPWQNLNLDAWNQIETGPGQEQLPGTFSKRAGRDPDYLFVYYKSELRVKKWEHDLRPADMLRDLLDEFDESPDKDIDATEVAAGTIFTFPDGEYRVEHKQLANPEVREHAEELLDEWLGEWRSLNQARDPASGQFV